MEKIAADKIRLVGWSRPSGTTISSEHYSVSIGKNGYTLRERKTSLLYLVPLVDVIIFTYMSYKQPIVNYISEMSGEGPAVQSIFPLLALSFFVGELMVLALLIIRFLIPARPWHGCEHKLISAAERDDIENAKNYSVIHDRCGGTYIFTMCIVAFVWILTIGFTGIVTATIASMLIESRTFHERNKIGIWFGRIIQKYTTKEPTEEQLHNGISGVRAMVIKERNYKNRLID